MSVLPFRAPRRLAKPSSLIVSTIRDSSLLDSHGFSPGTIFIITPKTQDFSLHDLILVRAAGEYFIGSFQPPGRMVLQRKLMDLAAFEVVGAVSLALTAEEACELRLLPPLCIKHVL